MRGMNGLYFSWSMLAFLLLWGGLCTPVFARVIVSPEAQMACRDSCWVWMYEDQLWKGENVILCGPMRINAMRVVGFTTGRKWDDSVGSLIIGDTAEVQIWEDEDFAGETRSFVPGQFVPTLDTEPDLEDEVSSMAIACTAPPTAAEPPPERKGLFERFFSR